MIWILFGTAFLGFAMGLVLGAILSANDTQEPEAEPDNVRVMASRLVRKQAL